MKRLRAVIYVFSGIDQERHQRACIAWCERRRYQVVSLVIDDRSASRWPDVCRMATTGAADLVVVFDRDNLPPARLPRVEGVGPMTSTTPPRQRRPRSIRRTMN